MIKKILLLFICFTITFAHFSIINAADSPEMVIADAAPKIDGLAKDPSQLTTNIFNLIFVITIGLAFSFLIYGSILWITSNGDKSKMESALNTIRYAIIGLLILASTWAIFILIVRIAFDQNPDNIEIPKLNEAGS